jgi:hypothetical protein
MPYLLNPSFTWRLWRKASRRPTQEEEKEEDQWWYGYWKCERNSGTWGITPYLRRQEEGLESRSYDRSQAFSFLLIKSRFLKW